jgi:hypothetical protein
VVNALGNAPTAVEDVPAELLVEVAQVPAELVEEQRQREGHVLAFEAEVAIADGSVAEPAGRLLDGLLVGS